MQRTDIVDLAVGLDTGCALHETGTVSCWGQPPLGDHHTSAYSPTPVDVIGLDDAIAVEAGESHLCSLRADRTVMCWGGAWTPLSLPSLMGMPTEVPGWRDVIALAPGRWHVCALMEDGTVSCFGTNRYGQLGDGSYVDRDEPVRVVGVDDVIALGAGTEHTCAVRSDGGVWCWGRNQLGQVRPGGDPLAELVAVQALGIRDAIDVHGGDGWTCVTTASDEVQCWGRMDDEELPGEVIAIDAGPVDQLDIGWKHACVREPSGVVECWGDGTFGVLGDGTDTAPFRLHPERVRDLDDAIDVSTGGMASCALRANGEVTCWGRRFDNRANLLVPTPVPGLP